MESPVQHAAHRGSLVFAQPFVVTWVGIWFLNDHIFKEQYASWWTGKLSDVSGLIVFPLIVAALIERRTHRPIEWAIGVTIVFYGSMNLLTAADAATETVIGAFMGPVTLTMDPTDLLVLPALAGAFWAWSNVPAKSLRRSWGRVVFAAAVATTLATSPPSARSETFAGTVLLTDEAPSMELPFTFTLDGEKSDDLMPFETQLQIVPYGRVPVHPVVETLEFIEPGSGIFKLTLAPGVGGPVEVRWSLYAWTEGEGGLFGGTDPAVPVLTADPPADTFGPEPALEVVLQIPGPDESPAHRLTVEAGPDTTIRVVTASPLFADTVRVATEDAVGWLGVDAPVDLRRPARCDDLGEEPCRFDIYVGGVNRWGTINLVVLVLEGNAEVVEQGVVEMTRHTVTGTTPRYRFDAPEQRPLSMSFSYDPIADALDAAMTFVEVTIDEPPSSDDFRVQSWPPGLSFVDRCCAEGHLSTWHRGADLDVGDAFDEPLEFTLEWEAVVWTPGEIDPDSIKITLD